MQDTLNVLVLYTEKWNWSVMLFQGAKSFIFTELIYENIYLWSFAVFWD